ncbi:glycosyltransferase [Virgibacillus indicus]|uniref:glycosyltransferase n=1 Tax=Virgibacillus indicus TaxID=2024554 RepID=UPI00197D8965|nr:glycosyltransferase [Virgibacillus indicus]
MINVLFISEDTSRMLTKNYFYLENELKKLVNLMIWRKSGHISYILNQLPARPNFILLLNDLDRQMAPMIKGLSNINIPTGLFVNDVHRFLKLRRDYINKNKIPYIFTVVRDKSLSIYPEFKNNMEWFPNFFSDELHKDYGLKKDINLLMMGAVNDYYPLRQKIIHAYSKDSDFVYHSHPGYREFSKKEESQSFIGHTYAKEINRAKIFFTTPSILKYPVAKYFEVLAGKTLLLAPTFKELEDLGFIPGFHFVQIDENNFKEKASYYLANESKRQKIAEQGYHFVHSKHTVKLRAQQLVKKIKTIIRQ